MHECKSFLQRWQQPHITARSNQEDAGGVATEKGRPFGLDYAPHFGMFRNHASSLADQVKFMADQGFRSLEDNGMGSRTPEAQDEIRAEMDKHDMRMGVFVASGEFGKVDFASDDASVTEGLVKRMERAVEVAKRVRARWCTVVPGRFDTRREWDYQTARVVDNLRRLCDVVEGHGLTMVLEPLNAWRDHPGLFLTKIPQAFLVCRAVNRPSCKILFDIYHQQITEGNLIPNIDMAWSETGYFQVGDHPGRKEPGTGEINYQNVFRHLKKRGFDGIVGMEHGNSKGGAEGELAVIESYRQADA